MTTVYELWDSASGNLLETYATRDEALDDIDAAIAEHGPEIATTLLLSEDTDGQSRCIASGSKLVKLVRASRERQANATTKVGIART